MKLPLSLVIITQNEALNIARCISSVPWASEIIVLDSGSQDQTVTIAQSLGAKVTHQEWLGYGSQKFKAVELAQFDWVLCLDADEALSPELSVEIQDRFKSLNEHVGYCIPRKSFYLGRWITHGGWYPDYQLRMFNRRFGQWPKDSIHERVHMEQTKEFQSPILHYVFRNIVHHVATNNHYSTLQAQAAAAGGKKFSLAKMLFKPCSKFLECYVLKLGFLDGLPGFFIAVGAAYSVFIRWGKIWENQTLVKKGLQK